MDRMSGNQPTSSSTATCTHCQVNVVRAKISQKNNKNLQEAKQTLKYVLPVPTGKKEFCSELCLTDYRKSQKAISSNAATNSSAKPSPQITYNQSQSSTAQPKPGLINIHKMIFMPPSNPQIPNKLAWRRHQWKKQKRREMSRLCHQKS